MAKRERPPVLTGTTYRMKTECGTLFVTINSFEGKPIELMGRMGKSGGCVASHIEAIGRLASLAMRNDIPAEEIMKQLRAIRCPQRSWNGGDEVFSCADAFSKALQKNLKIETDNVELMCPRCNQLLVDVEGVMTCPKCAYEKGGAK